MLLLFPLPGYLAKWMQILQIQRMEKVRSIRHYIFSNLNCIR